MSYESLKTAAEWGYRACEKGMNLQMAMIEFDKVFPPPTPNEDPPLWRRLFTAAEQETMASMMIEELGDRSAIRDQAIETLDSMGDAELTELIAYVDPDVDITCECLRAIQEHNASMDDYRSGEHVEHFVAAQFIERWDLVQNAEELSDRGRKYLEEYG